MGVCCLNDQKNIVRILKNLPIKEVWGIGHNLSRQLNQLGIYSAYELMQMDIRYIRKKFSVVLERTVRELRGGIMHSNRRSMQSKKTNYSK
jgi:DNA polymerase V